MQYYVKCSCYDVILVVCQLSTLLEVKGSVALSLMSLRRSLTCSNGVRVHCMQYGVTSVKYYLVICNAVIQDVHSRVQTQTRALQVD
jgi:hypothetical protein